MTDRKDVLTRLYRAFNDRHIDAVLEALHPAVDWPNGWEGGRLHGREAVRAYWLRQWNEINPSVEPIAFSEPTPDTVQVTVHQVVRDLAGALLLDASVTHVYLFEHGLVQRMDIEHPRTA